MLICIAGRESPSSSSPASQSTAEAAATQFACIVTTTPQLLSQLPAAARKEVTEPPVLTMMMTALHRLASHHQQTDGAATPSNDSDGGLRSDGCNQSASSGTGLRGNGSALFRVQLESREAALVALGNLARLLCGERVSKPAQVC